MVDGYWLYVILCKIGNPSLKKKLSYGQYMEIWFGLVWLSLIWFGLVLLGRVWFGLVDGYFLDVIPCKIWKSYFQKQLGYGQYIEIWFGLVWVGLVWFGCEWYDTWALSRCTTMKNFELLAWKMAEILQFYLHDFGKIAAVAVGNVITKAL